MGRPGLFRGLDFTQLLSRRRARGGMANVQDNDAGRFWGLRLLAYNSKENTISYTAAWAPVNVLSDFTSEAFRCKRASAWKHCKLRKRVDQTRPPLICGRLGYHLGVTHKRGVDVTHCTLPEAERVLVRLARR
jgi:hypothetical protein